MIISRNNNRMNNNFFRQINVCKNICRNYIPTKENVDSIINFTRHNIKYINRFELTIRNPNKCNFLYPTTYESTIWFEKNNMNIYKNFQNKNFQNLMDEVTDFISKEIKI